MPNENKFPSEIVDLPSGGKLYPKDNPLSSVPSIILLINSYIS